MRGIVIYCSVFGNNRETAEKTAKSKKYDIIEFFPGGKARIFLSFFTAGKLRKMAKAMNLIKYDNVVLCGPVWAGKPCPALMALLKNLDLNGKNVSCLMTYSTDHGHSEKIARQEILKNKGKIKEIRFRKV